MTDIHEKISSKIQAHRLENLPVGDDLQMPVYGGLSLVNLPGTVAKLLDVPPFGQPALDEVILDTLGGPYKKVVLVLVDALGYQLFNKMLDTALNMVWEKYLDNAVYCPITSICPSTTASALTTLWTGEPASAHGVIGYEMWAKEFGTIINNISHAPAGVSGDMGGLRRFGFDSHDFMNKPLLGTHLWNNGVSASAFMHTSIANSGLSTMQMDDVDVKPYVDEADLFISLADFLNSRQKVREYVYVYYSHVDTLMHRYGDQDERVSLQFGAFSSIFKSAFMDKLSNTARKETLLILTADHGSVTTPRDPRYEMRRFPALIDSLVMQPTCENRLAFFYVKPGKKAFVQEFIEKTWPGEFYVIDSNDFVDSGLLGNPPFHPDIRNRVGDLVVISRGDAYLWWAPKPNHMAGRHGGLAPSEMLVPFYALPLGEI